MPTQFPLVGISNYLLDEISCSFNLESASSFIQSASSGAVFIESNNARSFFVKRITITSVFIVDIIIPHL